ncbi:HAD-IA family hydrolase [Bogoriella caseilytica]|nr:HAD-IA family hydrolase [Bogoriella caseilytica]
MPWTAEAILFDIDGTLVDSTDAVDRCWAELARRHDLDVEEVLKYCHGRRAADTLEQFLPPDERDKALQEITELELSDLEGVRALPATTELLPRLSGSRWAAVTSGTRALMSARMSAAGLPVPEILVTAENVERGKPDPQGYLQAAAALGVDPARCVVIEDAPAGVAAGKAAGAQVIAVTVSHPASAVAEADVVVPDLTHVQVEVGATGRLTLAFAG